MLQRRLTLSTSLRIFKSVGVMFIALTLTVISAAFGGGTHHKLTQIALSATTQNSHDRVIEKKKNSRDPHEPVEIVSVKTKVKTDREFGKTFTDDDDWFKGLRIKVKNVSGKQVQYVKIDLLFEPSGDTQNSESPPLLHSLAYGTKGRRASNDGILVLPGDNVELDLDDSTHAHLKRALAKIGYAEILNRLSMYVSVVIFDDDTMWTNGIWFRRDPTNAENWILMSLTAKASTAPVSSTHEVARFAPVSFSKTRDMEFRRTVTFQTNPCGLPGYPYLTTCVGASSSDCKKEYTPVYTAPSQYSTHKRKTVFVTCMLCTHPTPTSIDCNPANHCELDEVDYSQIAQVCSSSSASDQTKLRRYQRTVGVDLSWN